MDLCQIFNFIVGVILTEIHRPDLTPVLNQILSDAKHLSKKKKQKMIEVTAGRMTEILYEAGARFDPNGEEILWPGGCKSFKTSEVEEFIGPIKKGRPKKSKPLAEQLIDNWHKNTDNTGFRKHKLLF